MRWTPLCANHSFFVCTFHSLPHWISKVYQRIPCLIQFRSPQLLVSSCWSHHNLVGGFLQISTDNLAKKIKIMLFINTNVITVYIVYIYHNNSLLDHLALQSFNYVRTWWRLFRKNVVYTKSDIYVLIVCQDVAHSVNIR
jgi:hypothetical protein